MRAEKLLWFLAILGLIVCTPSLFIRFSQGLHPTDLGSYVTWGLWEAGYIYFVGLSAGAFLLSALVYVFGIKKLRPVGKLSLLTALVTLLAAMLSIWVSLGHMERFPKLIFDTSFTSLMGWMVWFYSAYFVLLLLELWFALRVDLVELNKGKGLKAKIAGLLVFGKTATDEKSIAGDNRMLKILGTIGVPLAIAFHGGVGALFAVVGARPFWNTSLFPIIFLVGALLSGGALLTFISYLVLPANSQKEEIISLLGKIVLAFLLIDVILELAEFLVNMYAGIPAHVYGMKQVLFGRFWWVFFIVHLGLGVILPILLFSQTKRSPKVIATVSFLIALTFFAVRLNIVIPGLIMPQLEGLDKAFQETRLMFHYFPTPVEWFVQFWIASLALFCFLVGFNLLPIVKKES